MTETLLRARDLTVSFQTDARPVRAVQRISFEVAKGEILAIVGESGSGKTVSSRAMIGLLPSTARIEGSAKIEGTELIGLRAGAMRAVRGDRIAMVFQEPSTALDPVRTVGWQIVEALRAHRKMTRRQALARAVELLDLVGIPDPAVRVHSYPHQMSGGQKQRVMIAMAISCDPEVIIADEPTTALDVTVQAQILDLLHDLRERLGTAIILITHNMGVVADLSDRVAVMFRGELVEQGTAEDVFARPQHPYTKHLLASVPYLGRERPASMNTAAPPIEAKTVLTVENLEVFFPGRIGSPPVRAIDGVSLELSRHEILALVGESGSGKTTLGRCAVGLLEPTAGELTVLGQPLAKIKAGVLRDLRKRLGFVFQDPAASLNPRMSVGACVSEPMRVHGVGTSGSRRARVAELLEAVELPVEFAERYPHELSGGQRQRVSLARALVMSPELLVADEPTSALDVSVQAKVLEVFVRLQHQMGFACLFITHDLAVVDLLADRIAVMKSGRLVELGTREQVLRDPQEQYTKDLIAAVPLPDPVAQRERQRARRRQPGKSNPAPSSLM
ncbi:MAG: ABC transporter ATP-binding protein [Bifidobacteriaceae bacterium]|jgi:ABC-type glutathione transport system ATPase component|nr:ABC transporter ATP-binding protein [Bifidobacteriaceae bacterium]